MADDMNHWVCPPASTPPAQQDDNFSFINTFSNQNTAIFGNAAQADPVFPPHNQSSSAPFLWRQTNGAYQTHQFPPSDTSNNLMVDLNQPPNFQYPLHYPNNLNFSGNSPNPYQQSYAPMQCENRAVMNVPPQINSFQNPGLNLNSSLNVRNPCEVIDLTLEDDCLEFGDTRTNNFHTPGISNFNQNQINAAQFRSSGRVDGSFLSLGNEYRLNNVPNPNFSNRITGNLGRDVSSYSNMSHIQGARSSMNPAPNFGGFSGFRNNIGGLQNSQDFNTGGFSSVRNNTGDYLPNTMPSNDVRRQEFNRDPGFPKPSSSNLGFTPNADMRYTNIDSYDILRDRLTIPSGSFSNNPNEISPQIGVPNLAPSSVNFPQNATQPISDHLQKQLQESWRNNLARNVSSARYMGGSFGRGYSGHVPISRNSVAQAGNESAQLPIRGSNHPSGRIIPNPENYGHLQMSDRHGIPPGKRSIIHPDSSSHRAQRRRTMVQYPNISPYNNPSYPQTYPAGPIHVPSSRSGSGRVLEPSGYKCEICKRDLAFAPEGPIQQPSIPPGVAVLPCQHTFHDHCLQLITPEDDPKNPPCIPCAMGEK